MKAVLQFITPFVKKYPGVSLLIVMFLSNIWGYYSLASAIDGKADKSRVDSVHIELAFIKGELKGMAQYFLGKESFNGSPKTLPPKGYLIGIGTEILKNDFDSCKQSVVTDSVTGRPYWYCWAGDRIFTFK